MLDKLLRSRQAKDFSVDVPALRDLPAGVAAAFQNSLNPEEDIRQIILAPRQQVPARKSDFVQRSSSARRLGISPAWVLVLTCDRLLVATISHSDRPPAITSIPFADLLALELGEILLFSWIHFSWKVSGAVADLTVYFNTVSDLYYRRLLGFMQRQVIRQSGLSSASAGCNREVLAALPYKFKSIIPIYMLAADEQVQALVFQPEVVRSFLNLVQWQKRAATAVLLTNYHLLWVGEEISSDAGRYGWIARFYPRDRIQMLTCEKREKDSLLVVGLENQGVSRTVSLAMERSIEPRLNSLVRAFTDGEKAKAPVLDR